MGLGSLNDLPLAEARTVAAEARKLLALRQDPLEDRRHAAASASRSMTFKEAAEAYIADHEAAWGNAKHKTQWTNTLAAYAHPIIGSLPVSDINTSLVLKIIRPLWQTKTETASRVRQRIEAILGWATIHGYRTGDNPAAWGNHLEHALPAKATLVSIAHHPALPYAEIATFMGKLKQQTGMAPRALEFLILTGVRSGEALGARWEEIDLGQKLWVIPADRMKAGREHRVPLSDAALSIIEDTCKLRHADDGGFVFQGKRGRPLGSACLAMVLRRMGHTGITVHGFRSTLRDWAAEQTGFPHEVCEQVLAHAPRNAVVAAYQRGDLLEKRRQLMEAWASYCAAPAGDVIPMRKQRAPATVS
jgi:integrase